MPTGSSEPLGLTLWVNTEDVYLEQGSQAGGIYPAASAACRDAAERLSCTNPTVLLCPVLVNFGS